MSVSNICHVRKVSRYIPLSVLPAQHLLVFLITYIMLSVRSVCNSSLKSHLLLISSRFFCHRYAQLLFYCLLILFNTFSFTDSAKAISICNIFSIISLSLLLYVGFYKKNGEGGNISLVWTFLKCFLDYLYIFEGLKMAWLINQTKFTTTFKILH